MGWNDCRRPRDGSSRDGFNRAGARPPGLQSPGRQFRPTFRAATDRAAGRQVQVQMREDPGWAGLEIELPQIARPQSGYAPLDFQHPRALSLRE
jgi:hypothetical protein